MTETLARTPLYDWHAAHGGRLVDFAGWSMPVQYGSIAEEHAAVRNACGLFDVSHMGRLRFDGRAADGSDVAAFLDGILTRRTTDMKPGQVRYSLVTGDDGNILEDVLISRLQNAAGGTYWLLVVNASNREKIVAWLTPRVQAAAGVQMTDCTTTWAMIAVQGPLALEIVQPLVDAELKSLKYYHGVETRLVGPKTSRLSGIVSRTGYTGEDGCELIVGSNSAVELWETILDLGNSRDARACGLGARDTLRLEAAMPLYGHELSETINPYQAGLGFAVNLEGRTFPGRDALAKLKDAAQPRRVGLTLDGKRVPREHYVIMRDGRPVGEVTSGTFSPTLNKPIAMAYVEPGCDAVGTELAVDLRGRDEPCRVVPLPFYKRPN